MTLNNITLFNLSFDIHDSLNLGHIFIKFTSIMTEIFICISEIRKSDYNLVGSTLSTL